MRVLLTDPLACTDEFVEALRRLRPGITAYRWPELPQDGIYDLVLAWRLPEDCGALPGSVRAIFCFGAGADNLLHDPRIPAHLPIARLEDPGQAAQLLDYAAHAAFARLADDARRRTHQRNRLWHPPERPNPRRADIRVAVLGLGPIGRVVAGGLAALGFHVSAWSRTGRDLPDVEVHHGAGGLAATVSDADVLVNLLPLTPETENILSADLLSNVATGCYLVNLARGAHLIEQDLRRTLDSGRVGAAWLDAFRQEPLPPSHWFWQHERVRMTPHIGGLPTMQGAAASLAAVIEALESGAPLPGLIRAGSSPPDLGQHAAN